MKFANSITDLKKLLKIDESTGFTFFNSFKIYGQINVIQGPVECRSKLVEELLKYLNRKAINTIIVAYSNKNVEKSLYKSSKSISESLVFLSVKEFSLAMNQTSEVLKQVKNSCIIVNGLNDFETNTSLLSLTETSRILQKNLANFRTLCKHNNNSLIFLSAISPNYLNYSADCIVNLDNLSKIKDAYELKVIKNLDPKLNGLLTGTRLIVSVKD